MGVTPPDFSPWHDRTGFLYKFRPLDPRSIGIIRQPHLYFAPIKSMSDRTEIGAEIFVPPDRIAIEIHLREYLAILQDAYEFEQRLLVKQLVIYEEDTLAPFRASRRRQNMELFKRRIDYAREMIESISNENCVNVLMDFYESIRSQLREASICCLSGSLSPAKMWDEYANKGTGFCVQFKDRIFSKNKKIEKVHILYTSDGRLHPLDIGYLKSYQSLFSTKHESYRYEDEVRLFILGTPRQEELRPADLVSVVLGTSALSSVEDDKREMERRANIRSSCEALIALNRARNREHHTILYESKWVGFRLFIRGIEPATLLEQFGA